MKSESLQCNHCGADLDVGPSTRFAKCEHCGSRLTIVRNACSTYTELVDKVNALDAKVSSSLAASQFHLELERIDREWEHEQQQYLSTDKRGNRHRPSKAGNAIGMVIAVGFGLFWTIGAFAMTNGGPHGSFQPFGIIFPLFGLVFIAVAIFGGMSGISKADKYDRAYETWQTRRRRLIEQHEQSESAEGIQFVDRRQR